MGDSDDNYDYSYSDSDDASIDSMSEADYSSLNEVETSRKKVLFMHHCKRKDILRGVLINKAECIDFLGAYALQRSFAIRLISGMTDSQMQYRLVYEACLSRLASERDVYIGRQICAGNVSSDSA